MDTRYPISRFVVTLIGAGAGLILFDTLVLFVSGPPYSGGCMVYRSMGGFSWSDSNPILSFLTALLWSGAAFGGTLLAWYRPRAGYFCAGMGYLLGMILLLMEFYASPWYDRTLDASGWILRIFALPVWLFWLCVHDEPPLLASKRTW